MTKKTNGTKSMNTKNALHTIETVSVQLGPQVVSNRFLADGEFAPAHDMTIEFHQRYGSMCLQVPFPIDDVCPRFSWIENFEPEAHLDDLVEDLGKIIDLSAKNFLAGFSFKDQSTLDRLAQRYRVATEIVDPIEDFLVTKRFQSIETLQYRFSEETARRFRKKHGHVQLLVIRHAVEHAYDISSFLNAAKEVVGTDGYIYLEIPDCKKGMKNGDCSILWEEHVHYFSAESFTDCLNDHELEVIYQKQWAYPLEDSIGFLVKIAPNIFTPRDLARDYERFVEYSKRLQINKKLTSDTIRRLYSENLSFCLLGAGHLATTFISINQISEFIQFVVDDNANKIGLFMPVGNIPIISAKNLTKSTIDVCLMSANPQHHQKIRDRLSGFIAEGGKVLSIFPGTPNYFLDEQW